MFKVAICDDQNIMHIMIKSHLTRYSEEKGITFNITDYMSGDEFLADYSDDNNFDIVISDISMPGKTGIETINELRKIEKKTTQVIFSSSWFDNQGLTMELMPWIFIDKPMPWDKFCYAMNKCIENIKEQ